MQESPMTQPDTAQTAAAMVCVFDALASSIDPTGRVMRDATKALRDGLAMADAFNSKSDAQEIVRAFLEHVENPE